MNIETLGHIIVIIIGFNLLIAMAVFIYNLISLIAEYIKYKRL